MLLVLALASVQPSSYPGSVVSSSEHNWQHLTDALETPTPLRELRRIQICEWNRAHHNYRLQTLFEMNERTLAGIGEDRTVRRKGHHLGADTVT